MSSTPFSVELKSVDFGYDSRESLILKAVNLGIPENSVCAILGPNGSGKTTMLHLILGMLKPDKGHLFICGQCMNEYLRGSLKQKIGLVPQKESIPFDLNILEYVLLGRAPHLGIFHHPGESDRAIAVESLKAVGLDHMMGRSVPSLSGGESQLAMVARSLTQETDILLMDEPTAHLDLANTRKILQIMRMLLNSGKTVIYTTNDPNAASFAADYIVLFKTGSIVASGDLKTVFTSENLSAVYGIDVDVLWSNGRPYAMMKMD
jgi:iron complex transport system ATP-binding protein